MTGRSLFSLVKPLTLVFGFLFKLLPGFISQFLWDISSFSEMKVFVFLRYCILKGRCKKCGDNVFIGKNVTIKPFSGISLGSNISIHNNCYMDSSGGIDIGDNVSIAHNSSLLSSSHSWSNDEIPIKYNLIDHKKTIIHEDVWIGCGVRIISGIEIGSRTIVGANSVCTKNLEARSIYIGAPASRLREL